MIQKKIYTINYINYKLQYSNINAGISKFQLHAIYED